MFRSMMLACVASLGLMGFSIAPTQAADFYHHRHHYHVQYRLPYWKESVFTCPLQARDMEQERLSKGFEVYTVRTGDVLRVRFRMMNWNTFETTRSHHEAHDVERFLGNRGYVTRVVHH